MQTKMSDHIGPEKDKKKKRKSGSTTDKNKVSRKPIKNVPDTQRNRGNR